MTRLRITCLAGVLLCFVNIVSGLVQSPANTAAVAGQSVRIACRGKQDNIFSLLWNHNGVAVSQNDIVVPAWRNKIAILADASLRQYDLYINATERMLSGLYACQDVSVLEGRAQHIVLDSDPTCYVNNTINGDSGKLDLIEGEIVQLTCETSYASVSGWNPMMDVEDKNTRLSQVTKNEVIEDGQRSRSTFSVTTDRSINNRQYTYSVRFPSPPNGVFPGDTQTVVYSRRQPEFAFRGETKPFDVKFKVENINVSPKKEIYIPGDIINCEATGQPTPAVKWINLETNNTEVVNGELRITEEMEGNRRYMCQASNSIRGVDYVINETINLSIMIPTTTTTTTTTTTAPSTTVTTGGDTGATRIEGGLPGWAIALIVIGSIIFLIFLCLLIFCLCCRRKKSPKAPVKEKTKPPVDAVRPVSTMGMTKPTNGYDNKPIMDDYDGKPPPTISNGPNQWGDTLSPPMYDVALDDTPRSRKPVQVYDSLDYTDFRRV